MSDTLLPSTAEQSIVVVGSLNPAIFHPSWFKANALVRDSDLDLDEGKLLVSSDVTAFTCKWFDLRATQHRLSFHANDPRMDLPLRDLVRGTFECLEHVPIKAFGFNCDQVFTFDSEEEATAVVNSLCPKAAWDQYLQSTSVEQVVVSGENNGKPMKFRIDAKTNIVKLSVNQHYDVPQETRDFSAGSTSAQFLIQQLVSDWEGFLDYVRRSSQQLVAISSGVQ